MTRRTRLWVVAALGIALGWAAGATVAEAAVTSGTWIRKTNGGLWTDTANWDVGDYVTGVGSTATFDGNGFTSSSDTSGARTVVINTAVTLGTWNVKGFFNTQTYAFSLSGGSLTLNQDGAGAGKALIDANYISSNRTFSIPDLILADDLDVNITGTTAIFAQSANWNDGGVARTITKTGIGGFAIGFGTASTSLTGGGIIDVQEGLLRLYKGSGGNYTVKLTTTNSKTLLLTSNTISPVASTGSVIVEESNSIIRIDDNTNTASNGVMTVGDWTVNADKTAGVQLMKGWTAVTNTGKTFTIHNGATVNVTNGTANGSGQMRIQGALRGSGTITTLDNGTGSTVLRILNSGLLAPGLSTGILNVGSVARPNTHLVLDSGSTFEVELNGPAAGTGYDRINLTGDVTVNGATLSMSLGYVPGPGTQLWILVNDGTDPINGTFDGLPEGSVVTLSYLGNDYDLYLTYQGNYDTGANFGGNDLLLWTPEPTSLALMVLSSVVLCWRKRRMIAA